MLPLTPPSSTTLVSLDPGVTRGQTDILAREAPPMTVRVDWIAGTCDSSLGVPPHRIAEFLATMTRDQAAASESRAGRLGFSGRAWGTTAGARVETADDDRERDTLINIPGGVLKRLDLDDQIEMLRVLVDVFRVRLTRLDLAFDDHGRTVDPADVVEAINQGNAGPRLKGRLVMALGRSAVHAPASDVATLNRGGWTVYVGAPSSDHMVRYYDKHAESGGKIDAWRWEVQARDAYARNCYGWIKENCEDASGEILAASLFRLLVGAVGFLDRSRSVRRERCPRLPWWDKFISGAIAAAIPARPVRLPSLARGIAWLRDQVAPTLATIREAMPPAALRSFLGTILEEGRGRMSPMRRAVVVAAQDGWDELAALLVDGGLISEAARAAPA